MRRPATLATAALFLATALSAQKPGTLTVRLHGTVLMNSFYNDAAVSAEDLPLTASLPGASGLPEHELGATVRQTRIIATADQDNVAGGQLHGELDLDFYGGGQATGFGRYSPVPRIRRAIGEIDWPRSTLLIGEEAPPISDVNPRSLAAIGFPGFSGSGNLWLWIPQIRFDHDLTGGDGFRPGIGVAVLAPTASGPAAADSQVNLQPTIAERSGRPSVEARLTGRWGGSDGGMVSIGGHYGWLATTGDTLLQSKGLAASAIVPFAGRFEFRGEAYTGQGMAALGGGAIGQAAGVGGVPVKSKGGWAQLVFLPNSAWEFGAGYGVDDPQDSELTGASARLKNDVTTLEATWRLAPIVAGLEVRHLATLYPSGTREATHVNLALGWMF
ncbi:MAG TPA: hypothetical protein VLC11_02895 [Gemmatimonadales bacterium]|nr:hypothetical protein [Gemmatimonadales bacterium]